VGTDIYVANLKLTGCKWSYASSVLYSVLFLVFDSV
jgi:hypothetical protein